MMESDPLLTPMFWVTACLILVAAIYSLIFIKQSWAPGYAAVIGTVSVWYFAEPLYSPELFAQFSYRTLDSGYQSVAAFLGTFMLVTPWMVRVFTPRKMSGRLQPGGGWYGGITVEKLLVSITVLWLIILSYGVIRVDGDLLAAMLPVQGRSNSSMTMFARAGGAAAGPSGFIVSTAAYLYQLCLGTFGLLLPIARNRKTRVILVILILVSWPYAFLIGTRNIALSVTMPMLISFLLFTRANAMVKGIVSIGAYYLIDFLMRAMVNFRNVGFSNVDASAVIKGKHLGLDMAAELMHITDFLGQGTLTPTYGGRYLAELLNFVPRAIWSDKPLIGIDYAIARGFGGAPGDTGVFATIATGLIGQGVLDFGNFFGPIIVGILMSIWVAILNRLRVYGKLPRTALFLIGLGTTFNLGRDITLLVLFPFVFGLIGVWILDKIDLSRAKRFPDDRVSARLRFRARPPSRRTSALDRGVARRSDAAPQ